MVLLVVVAELDIARPETPVEWSVLIFLGVLLLFVINEGVQVVTKKVFDPLKKVLLVAFAVLGFLFVRSTYDDWDSDPLVQVEVLDDDDNGHEDNGHEDNGYNDNGDEDSGYNDNGSSIGGTATRSPAAEGAEHGHDLGQDHDD
ncbi:MAG: hypothetical protein OER95_04640 [Acidimicrobiia bacterium]|nr:hypothetical protein [Acidimicrobiia bacterium]